MRARRMNFTTHSRSCTFRSEVPMPSVIKRWALLKRNSLQQSRKMVVDRHYLKSISTLLQTLSHLHILKFSFHHHKHEFWWAEAKPSFPVHFAGCLFACLWRFSNDIIVAVNLGILVHCQQIANWSKLYALARWQHILIVKHRIWSCRSWARMSSRNRISLYCNRGKPRL